MTQLDDSRPMATKIALIAPTPTRSRLSNFKSQAPHPPGDQRAVVVINSLPQDDIYQLIADVLGRPWRLVCSLADVKDQETSVLGIRAKDARGGLQLPQRLRTLVINTHCVEKGMPPDPVLSELCDYEILYYESPLFRRDLTRFLSFVLGQTSFHEDLLRKERSCLISTTFPNVRTAISNLDILTVGSDAVELRVDLLKEPRSDGSFSAIPSLSYVGEQVMLLRQRTELPIIYTTRCTNENGKFPMDDPQIYLEYLHRAIQWGVEYIDVELWLPEEIRKTLNERKGNSKIISAFHDFSGAWKWPSEEARRLFKEGAKHADIVKMNVMVNSMAENYELEYFRSTIRSKYSYPPLSAVNMGEMGQLSRALNTVFSPVTHPLLPIIAAPGQLSVAEINRALHAMGQLPKRDIYAIGRFRSTPQSVFFEKCFNELGLPHHFTCVDRGAKGSAETFVKQPNFGGAYINPPLTSSQSYIPSQTDAALYTGNIDTVLVHYENGEQTLVGDNAAWKGIRATLTREFVPSAYHSRAALVLSNSEVDAAPAIFALRSLQIGTVYTVGFKAHGPLASGLEPFTSVDSVKRVEQPFVIISALPPEKSLLVQPLLRHFSANGRMLSETGGKVFVDLAHGPRSGDPLATAAGCGWSAYGMRDVSAWTTVETIRLLVGQNVPFDFVRMASGRGLY
ncbi:hypothetical protein MMC20_005523 [Loxospora ochrophaea]|nr:hypothetical protein [Loxospora ochrophaea]